MSKVMKRKEIEKLVGAVTKGVMKEMNGRKRYSLSDEAKEVLADDKIREEIFCRVQEWVEEELKRQMEESMSKASEQIEDMKQLLKAAKKSFDKYQVDIKWLKQRVKDLEKKESELEKHGKQEKQILTRLAVGRGLVSPGASFREVRKGYKKYASKNQYIPIGGSVSTLESRYQLPDKNIIDM